MSERPKLLGTCTKCGRPITARHKWMAIGAYDGPGGSFAERARYHTRCRSKKKIG